MSAQHQNVFRSNDINNGRMASRPWVKPVIVAATIALALLIHIVLNPSYSPLETAARDLIISFVFVAPVAVAAYILWDALRLS
ncbi:MAG: hypothetical protein JXB47_15645 [Anaerolineae bacterium]|nr:hypothetical protein [Anaerolineae bacterium]